MNDYSPPHSSTSSVPILSSTTKNSLQSSLSYGSNNNNSGVLSGIYTWISEIGAVTWIIILLILSFLGVNIFMYLAKGTDTIVHIFKPIVDWVSRIIGSTSSQIIDITAEGGKEVAIAGANITTSTLTDIQNATPGGITQPSNYKMNMGGDVGTDIDADRTVPARNQIGRDAVNAVLTQAVDSINDNNNTGDFEADEATSTLQGAGKDGWCYIGTDHTHRTCAHVTRNDTCMSGDIFPSQEICINPNLR
jgi:hypothetical protein